MIFVEYCSARYFISLTPPLVLGFRGNFSSKHSPFPLSFIRVELEANVIYHKNNEETTTSLVNKLTSNDAS